MSEILHIRRYHFNTDTSDMLEGVGRNPNAPDPRFTHEDIHVYTGDKPHAVNVEMTEDGAFVRGDKAIKSNINYGDITPRATGLWAKKLLDRAWLSDALYYGHAPRKPLTFWERMERRWDEVKRRAVNAWAALRGDWESDYDY